MRIRLELELECQDCGATTWVKATYYYSDYNQINIDCVPTGVDIFEDPEYELPEGWVLDDYRCVTCPECTE